jgi:peptide/nickel transport system permease protein
MTTADTTAIAPQAEKKKAGKFNRFDNPLLNWKFITGASMIGTLLLAVFLGSIFWDTDLARAASSPQSLPPYGFTNTRGQAGVIEHPLGTEDSGRDMLAVMIVGIPRTLMVGLIASTVGMVIGIILGFTAGFVGGLADDIIRIITDVTITIPPLLVLIVIQSVVPRIEIATMAFLISLFQWPGPTRLIRAQVLSMKSSGYVLMARLSGAPTRDIMFKEMMPNLLPYLAASFIGNTAGAIITAIGLEVLGLGPQRVHSLGVTIYFSINAAGILRQMWWWWGLPTIALIIIFIGLLLINLGLDEVANPRLRQASE